MRRKKLNYLPGLISLIGLPMLIYFNVPIEKPNPVVLRLYLPTDEMNKTDFKFSKYSFYQDIKGKKIIEIDIDYAYVTVLEKHLYHSKMNFIKREMERLQFTYDTASVLKINLSDENTYGEFVWILNQAIIYDFKRYAYVDDCFYLLPNPPPIKHEPFPFLANDVIYNVKSHTKWDIFRNQLKNEADERWIEIKSNPLITIAFVLLILIPFVIKFIVLKKSQTIH